MSTNTKIEWTDATWNPTTGCDKVSPGCDHCYAERMVYRLAHIQGSGYEGDYAHDYPGMGFDVRMHRNRLEQPFHWRKPLKVFVDSMGDLFHEDVPDDFLDEIFGVILACSVLENYGHIFQILTKRPGRLSQYLTSVPPIELVKRWSSAARTMVEIDGGDILLEEVVEWTGIDNVWPLKNVWIGVTAENQQVADERIPLLLQCPAAVRFVSCEPLLGPINFKSLHHETSQSYYQVLKPISGPGGRPALDQIIVGGETGPGARPMHPDWVRTIRDDCQMTGTPFFFKGWGDWATNAAFSEGHPAPPVKIKPMWMREDGFVSEQPLSLDGAEQSAGDVVKHSWIKAAKLGKKKAGRELDGRTWEEFPK